MTAQPVEPVAPVVEPPVATATPPTDGPKPTEPPKSTEPVAPTNPWEDPKAAQAEIERLRKENGAARTNAKAQAAEEARNELAQQIGKALGLVKDEPVDPAKLTESLTAAQADARRAQVELAVFRAAAEANGDPAALLDSSSFSKSLDGIDPTDIAAVTAAIEAAVAANPRLGVATGPKAPAPNPAQGTSAGGPTATPQLSRDDVERLSREGKYAEIDQAREDGRLNTLLGIK